MDRPETVAGFIVLGARLTAKGEPGRVARMRLSHALELWQQRGCRDYVLLTGGVGPRFPCSEARAMAHWALRQAEAKWGGTVREALGACLVLEEASENTAASARYTLPLVLARGTGAVVLVTDAMHLNRAAFLFRRHFHPRGVRVHPMAARGVVRHYWRQRRYTWLGKMALREAGAWLKALGHLALGRQ